MGYFLLVGFNGQAALNKNNYTKLLLTKLQNDLINGLWSQNMSCPERVIKVWGKTEVFLGKKRGKSDFE